MASLQDNAAQSTFPWSYQQTSQWVTQMSRKREVKGHTLVKLAVGIFAFIVRRLSWVGTDRLGSGLGWLMAFWGVRKKVAMVNLDIVYGDKKTTREKEAIYKASMLNLGRHSLNYLRVPLMDETFWANFEFVNQELLDQAYNQGKGIIFIGGHIGEWEIAAGRIGMAGYPIAIVAKKQPNPVVDQFIIDARIGMNLGTINHRKSMERVLEGLRNGEGVIMAVDQNMKRSQGIFVDWMGRTASTVRSNAWVARETGAPVVAGYAYRYAPAKYRLVITEKVPWEPCPDDPDRELLINTQNQASAVAKIIYDHPELWLWIHRRWKVQPDGVPNPYE